MPRPPLYDVGLSHASEDRAYVLAVRDALEDRGVRTWCYEFDRGQAVGRRIAEFLDDQIARCERYFVPFLSPAYVAKVWTRHELRTAEERPFRGWEGFVLPVRLDGVDTSTLMPGVASWEALPPAELATQIAERVAAAPSAAVEWFEPVTTGTGPGVRLFQELPIAGDAAPLDTYAARCVARLLATATVEDGTAWWTVDPYREFERLWATSSALTALRQARLDPAHPVVSGGDAFLAGFDVGHIDHRAAAIYRLSIDDLSDREAAVFVALLAVEQISGPERGDRGSFLLAQGPAAAAHPGHRGPLPHYGANYFHACHLADALLHLPARHRQARVLAEPVLDGLRAFLGRALDRGGGWLSKGEFSKGECSEKLPLTSYAYALLPRLGLPLPPGWHETARESFALALTGQRGLLTEALAPINLAYIHATTGSATLREKMLPDVLAHARRFTTDHDPETMSTIDTAMFLRATLSAAWFVDPLLYSGVCLAAREAAR